MSPQELEENPRKDKKQMEEKQSDNSLEEEKEDNRPQGDEKNDGKSVKLKVTKFKKSDLKPQDRSAMKPGSIREELEKASEEIQGIMLVRCRVLHSLITLVLSCMRFLVLHVALRL